MTDHRIIGKRHNNPNEKIVTHVKIANVHPIETVINWIEKEGHTFYTMYGNIRANVRVEPHPITGTKFLISSADGTPKNNIDNLPDC